MILIKEIYFFDFFFKSPNLPTLQLGGPCKDHVWAIKGQSFGKFKGQKGATGQASSPKGFTTILYLPAL